MNHMVNGNKGSNLLGNGHSQTHIPELSLEQRLQNSVVPRKSFEVYDEREEIPITCAPEVIEIAQNYLAKAGVDTRATGDTGLWDIFWAHEMAAAKITIVFRGINYQKFLPGRNLAYELLADAIASLFNGKNGDSIKGKKVAELGGGSGMGLVFLAQNGALVTNVDSSVMALQFSQYLAERAGPHSVGYMLNVVKEDFYHTHFENDKFDAVYNAGVFEHLDDSQAKRLLNEMIRITKPGGYVVISIPNERSPFYRTMQNKERSVYKRFKNTFVRLPWEERRRPVNFRGLMEGSDLSFVTQDGLLIPPSQEVRTRDILPQDKQTFLKYLSPDPYQSVDGIIANWRGFQGSTVPEFRLRYGMSLYAVGVKKTG